MNDLDRAINEFKENKFSCVLIKGEKKYVSTERGIAPLLNLINEGIDLNGFSVADKIVGKAAAMLYCLMSIKAIYAAVVSNTAIELLKQQGIDVQYDTQAEKIINRAGTDICPMEQAVSEIEDVQEGYLTLQRKVDEMKKIFQTKVPDVQIELTEPTNLS